MILIIPNIVQNLYFHLSMPFILGLHPPYPTSPTYPKPCYPPLNFFFFLNFHKNFIYSWFTSPIPHIPHLPQTLLPPPPPSNFFFEFSQKLYFSVHIHPDPQTRPPPTRPDPTPPPPQKKKKNFFFGIFT